MKHSNYGIHRQPAYPNAADSSYFTGKALQLLAALASGFGATAVMVFLVMLA